MVRLAQENILLVGDSRRMVQAALVDARPGARVTSVESVFDAIGELTANSYSAILVAAAPIKRRPEPAVAALRAFAGNGRLLLFGHPTLEPLSRKMMQFGCDEYLLTPPTPADLRQALGDSPMHMADPSPAEEAAPQPPAIEVEADPASLRKLGELPIADIFLEALLQFPHDAANAAIQEVNARIGPDIEFHYSLRKDPQFEVPRGRLALSRTISVGDDEVGALHLVSAAMDDETALRHVLSQIGHLFAKVVGLQDRHNRLQRLAIVDDLTGLYNARYFRHFLSRTVERAKEMRFPVTLLLFDIDDFKKYNDLYGHGVGDEILKQTAQLMRRCCREHDLVARIGGDEFAVVFWDKEGPRQPLDPKKPVGLSRPPQTPVQMFERFKRLAASSDFSGLGQSGRGRLSVSGGLAVYPYDAQDVDALIKAADDFLMFKAKKTGKNSVYLVEGQENGRAGPGVGL